MNSATGPHGTAVDDACCGACPCDGFYYSRSRQRLICSRGCGHTEDES